MDVKFLFIFLSLNITEALLDSVSQSSHSIVDYHEEFDDNVLLDDVEEYVKDVGSKFIMPESIHLDSVPADDFEDFDLYDIIHLSEADIKTDIDDLTSEERQEIADHHNLYRSNTTGPIVSASDMLFMEYNRTLEWGIFEYLKTCKFEHGRAKVDNMSKVINQNLYKGPAHTITRALYRWYMEWPFFDYENTKCNTKKEQCGHFVLMMWGFVQHVGCSRRSHCFPLNPHHKYIGCHYYPGGNIAAKYVPIYRYGPPCTRNTLRDGNLCYKNLGVDKSICNYYNLDCTCEAKCKNCAVLDAKKCRCKCKAGWDWEDCSFPCQNRHEERCNYLKKQKVRTRRCSRYIFGYAWCRHLCGRCPIETVPNTTLTVDSLKIENNNLCCSGKICPNYYVLNEETCECENYCPSPLCMFNRTVEVPMTMTGNQKHSTITPIPTSRYEMDSSTTSSPKSIGNQIVLSPMIMKMICLFFTSYFFSEI